MSISVLLVNFFIILLHQPLFCSSDSKPQTSYYTDYTDSQTLNLIPKQVNWLFGFGAVNTIATLVTVQLVIINVVVFKLRELHELKFSEKFDGLSLLALETICRQFSIEEILLATNDFDDSLVIGRGGFGKVYKGTIDNGVTTVAIKRLGYMSKQGATEFRAEITMLSKFRHSNIVSLIGYCEAYNELILVYEYILHGTIADHLYKIRENGGDHVHLGWIQRLKICIGAARGLDYLHSGTGIKERVIHRDVKSSNILLDENLAARIADFGLSKIGPANLSFTHVSTNVKGTLGYMDPEYFYTHRLTRKSDVYAFGVVLFEVLCGRPAIDIKLDESQRSLARWARHCVKEGIYESIVDPSLRWEIFSESLSVFVKIAEKCLNESSKERPTMSEVVAELEFSVKAQERKADSLAEEDIFEISESSTEEKVVTAVEVSGNKNVGSDIDVGRMNVTKKLRTFFLVSTWWISRNDVVAHAVKTVPTDKNGNLVREIKPISARKTPKMESIDSSGEEELAIPRLESTKTELRQRIAKEARGNAILQASLERRKQAVHERRVALEQDVSSLQEQLQAERDLRAALNVGLSMSSGQFSGAGPRTMDSKTKAELEEMALAEADVARLKQKVAEQHHHLNLQRQNHYGSLSEASDRDQHVHNHNPSQKFFQQDNNERKQRTDENLLGPDSRSLKGQILTAGSSSRQVGRKKFLESTTLTDSKSAEISTSIDEFGAVDSASISSTSRATAKLLDHPRHPSPASSTLVELTTRLDFFKERRSQLMEQLHNLDLNYGATSSAQDFMYKPPSPTWN